MKLKLYNPEKSKAIATQIAIIVGFFIVLYFLYPSTDKSISVAAIFILLAYFIFFDKIQPTIGNVFMNSHEIKIQLNENEIQLELSKLDKFELIYSGYKGKKVKGDLIPNYNKFSGLDNYLNIEKDGEIYNYKFQVENEIQEKELIELINIWENLGYDISKIRINK